MKRSFYFSHHLLSAAIGFKLGLADIFSDAHRCVCRIYLTYFGYSTISSDNAEVDADIRIRIAIPNWNRTSLVDFDLFTAAKSFSWESGRLVGGQL